jgi:hypothetical protein
MTLVLAGAAVEIVHPATLARLENFAPDAQLGFLSLALSGWMYRFALVGLSVLIATTSVVLGTGVMPIWWLALAGKRCSPKFVNYEFSAFAFTNDVLGSPEQAPCPGGLIERFGEARRLALRKGDGGVGARRLRPPQRPDSRRA